MCRGSHLDSRPWQQSSRTITAKSKEHISALHIEFRACEVAETKDLDENTLLDLDKNGQLCAITIEHAKGSTSTIVPSSAGHATPRPPRAAVYKTPAEERGRTAQSQAARDRSFSSAAEGRNICP
jgi:uncharacterized protein YuzE